MYTSYSEMNYPPIKFINLQFMDHKL